LQLFPRAEDERPLGIVALSVYAVAIAFIIYALVMNCVSGLTASIAYFQSLFQGGTFSLPNFLLNTTAAFLLLALIVAFIGFAVLAKGLASIKIPLVSASPNGLALNKPDISVNPSSKTETGPPPEANNRPFDLAGAVSQGRKTSLAIVTFVLILSALVGGGSYYVYFAGYSVSLVMLFTAGPFALALLSLIFIALASPRRGPLYILGAVFGLASAIASFTVLGFIVYEAILARSYADLFTMAFLILAGEVLGLLIGGSLALTATFKTFSLRKLAVAYGKVTEPKVEVEAKKPSIQEMEIKGPLEVPSAQSKSSFDGTLGGYLGTTIVNCLMTFFSLGIAYPWAYCRTVRWRARHTVYGGYRVEFSGKGSEIAGPWFGWLLLCVLTLGIYALWIPGKLKNFEAKHSRLVLE